MNFFRDLAMNFFRDLMMKHNARKWMTFTLRWAVAIAGIYWVLAQTPFTDKLSLVNSANEIVQPDVLHDPPEDAAQFQVREHNGRVHTVSRDEVWTQPDRRTVHIKFAGKAMKVKLLAIRPGAHYKPGEAPAELLVRTPDGRRLRVKPPSDYTVRVPYPMVDIGVVRLVRFAHIPFLIAALLVLPLSYLITSRRWHLLLKAMDIHLTQARTFVLNMVGAFYNTFMPGSTGGDLIKAYYAARHTTHRVRAVLSVIVDRVIGLIALIILGGVMASVQWDVPDCRSVALACAGMLLLTVIGLVVFYHPVWRRALGVDWMIQRLPMQRQVHHAVEAMHLYGRQPGSSLMALVMTFPVHATTVVSATLAGLAFGIKMPLLYYWTVVPVVTLVGAIPISPQGAGVMEAFAVLLTRTQGVTISQAIALAMAIRFGQMFWNLVAGIFVLRGGYHAPTQKEKDSLESDDETRPMQSTAIARPTPNPPLPHAQLRCT